MTCENADLLLAAATCMGRGWDSDPQKPYGAGTYHRAIHATLCGMTRTRAAAAVLSLALLAGCGGAGKTQMQSWYLRFANPMNAATQRMSAQMRAVPADVTGPQVAEITMPVADRLQSLMDGLLRHPWPSSVAPDVRGLADAVAAWRADLEDVAGQDALTIQSWLQQFAHDSAAVQSRASVVRADLGLSS